MTDPGRGANYRYVSRKRRTREDKRFVAGKGRFAADIALPGMTHVALVASPHPRARIRSIDAGRALASPGVHAVLTGDTLAAETAPLFNGLDIPAVKWFPLAVGMTRYAGEWVAAVAADSRYLAEDAAELVAVDYEPLPAAVGIESLLEADSPLVHPDHGSNVLLRKTFSWGPVAEDFARSEQTLSYRARWGRSSTVPIETFGVLASWDPIREILDVWASIQMPNYQEQIAAALKIPTNAIRVHNDVDVGGSYGVKRGIKHTVIAGYLARSLGRPVRLIEDRLDNMSGGDAHGPDRLFDVTLAFDGDGTIRSMKLRAIDDVGAYPGRGPLQLGKPITALVGPYRLSSVAYEAISVTSNKTGQVPVRGFGQSPTNFMIETGIDRVARHLGIDRIEIRRRNLIESDQFPWRIPTGAPSTTAATTARCSTRRLRLADHDSLTARRDAARAAGRLAGIGIATCLEPGGGNNIFEQLLNEKLEITTFVESCLMRVDMHGHITAVMSTTTSGQGHETLIATVGGEELERDPDTIRVTHADSLEALPTRSPVASRMAIVLGSATLGRRAQDQVHDDEDRGSQSVGEERLEYQDGTFFVRGAPARKLSWEDIAGIAHRQFHRLPPGVEPCLQAFSVLQVPGASGQLPNEKQEIQLYPCFSFQAHVPYVEIDPGTGQVAILDYAIGHDCGTVINPDIVRGMIVGGLAHGIGAALYEKFAYDETGQFLSGSFVDYLLPSAHEIPVVRDVEHCTPSPRTSLGQKGSGEGGYLGAPAAIASAVNDALAPLGTSLSELPMRLCDIEAAIHSKRTERTG